MDNFGIYIHIPFCLRKCYYCDFYSYAGLEHLYLDYVIALQREMENRSREFSGICVDTVYIGGGTPNLLPIEFLEETIFFLSKYFYITKGAEFTVEANPGVKKFINKKNLKRLKACGVNRLSFGAQSFDNRILKAIGRIHTAPECIEAVRAAYEVGLDNISLDLMYGLPGQSAGHFRRSLAEAVELKVNHISVYGLKVEDGTPLVEMLEKGGLSLPCEDEETKMYDFAIDYLTEASYSRYEISNFAKPGSECRHNLKYWEYSPYLGIGAAAHSFFEGSRTANTPSVNEYLQKIASDQLPIYLYDEISLPDKMAEFIFLALRTAEGLYYERFNNYFKIDFLKEYGSIVKTLAAKGLLVPEANRIFLTRQGMKFGNQVFQEFLPG